MKLKTTYIIDLTQALFLFERLKYLEYLVCSQNHGYNELFQKQRHQAPNAHTEPLSFSHSQF